MKLFKKTMIIAIAFVCFSTEANASDVDNCPMTQAIYKPSSIYYKNNDFATLEIEKNLQVSDDLDTQWNFKFNIFDQVSHKHLSTITLTYAYAFHTASPDDVIHTDRNGPELHILAINNDLQKIDIDADSFVPALVFPDLPREMQKLTNEVVMERGKGVEKNTARAAVFSNWATFYTDDISLPYASVWKLSACKR